MMSQQTSRTFLYTYQQLIIWMLFLIDFRLILTTKPLQYKTTMTKRRIHTIYITLFLFYSITGTISFALFLRDFDKEDKCRLFNIVTKTAYVGIQVSAFSIGSAVMVFNYVIIIYKLTRSKKSVRDITNGSSIKLSKNNLKLTKAIIMTLTAYILFYIPVVAITSVGTFSETFTNNSLFDIVEDISILLYFTNNLINPFIYNFTLRDFKEGYNRLLFCRVRHPIQENPAIRVAVI